MSDTTPLQHVRNRNAIVYREIKSSSQRLGCCFDGSADETALWVLCCRVKAVVKKRADARNSAWPRSRHISKPSALFVAFQTTYTTSLTLARLRLRTPFGLATCTWPSAVELLLQLLRMIEMLLHHRTGLLYNLRQLTLTLLLDRFESGQHMDMGVDGSAHECLIKLGALFLLQLFANSLAFSFDYLPINLNELLDCSPVLRTAEGG
jgi:hypothetical protein